jgi:hypothetical protein
VESNIDLKQAKMGKTMKKAKYAGLSVQIYCIHLLLCMWHFGLFVEKVPFGALFEVKQKIWRRFERGMFPKLSQMD